MGRITSHDGGQFASFGEPWDKAESAHISEADTTDDDLTHYMKAASRLKRERGEARQRAERVLSQLRELRQVIHEESRVHNPRKYQLANWESQIHRMVATLAADPEKEGASVGEIDRAYKAGYEDAVYDQPAEAGGEE